MELSLAMTFFLCFCVFLAGFVDSAAGGGGLISLPAYLFAGLPPHQAIACNKFSAACGTTFSAFRFFKHGALEMRTAFVSAAFSFISSFYGMRLALMINQDKLKTILIFFLPVIAVILLLKRDFGLRDESKDIPLRKSFVPAAFIGISIGFYDGLIGPGTGTIAVIAFSAVMKYGLKTASGNAKILNLASNYASLLAVIIGGKVIYGIAIPAAFCSLLGNFAGSGLALKKGAAFIRPLIIAVILLLFGKLFYDISGKLFSAFLF